jgi:hypothetical protein
VGKGSQQTYVLVLHAVVAILSIAAVTVLVALHDLEAQAAVAIFGTAIGLAGGSASAVASLGASVNGKSVVSEGILERVHETVQAAVSELGRAAATGGRDAVAGGRRAGDPPAPSEHAPPAPDPQAATA